MGRQIPVVRWRGWPDASARWFSPKAIRTQPRVITPGTAAHPRSMYCFPVRFAAAGGKPNRETVGDVTLPWVRDSDHTVLIAFGENAPEASLGQTS